jgi:hypothetical protein
MLRGTNETLDASPILEEFDGADADLGVFLWQAVRDALVWADTAPEERHGAVRSEGVRVEVCSPDQLTGRHRHSVGNPTATGSGRPARFG